MHCHTANIPCCGLDLHVHILLVRLHDASTGAKTASQKLILERKVRKLNLERKFRFGRATILGPKHGTKLIMVVSTHPDPSPRILFYPLTLGSAPSVSSPLCRRPAPASPALLNPAPTLPCPPLPIQSLVPSTRSSPTPSPHKP
jgi:hypothetical protein